MAAGLLLTGGLFWLWGLCFFMLYVRISISALVYSAERNTICSRHIALEYSAIWGSSNTLWHKMRIIATCFFLVIQSMYLYFYKLYSLDNNGSGVYNKTCVYMSRERQKAQSMWVSVSMLWHNYPYEWDSYSKVRRRMAIKLSGCLNNMKALLP